MCSAFQFSSCRFSGFRHATSRGHFDATFCNLASQNQLNWSPCRLCWPRFVSVDSAFRSHGVGRGRGRVNHDCLCPIWANIDRNSGAMTFLIFSRFREPTSPTNIQNSLLTLIVQWREPFSSFTFSSCSFGGVRRATALEYLEVTCS